MFATNFLTNDQVTELVTAHGTPIFVYSRRVIKEQAHKMLSVPAPFGLTIRYAMKANSHPDILTILRNEGVKIDASSGYEAALAIKNGFAAKDILLTSQQLAHNIKELVDQGVEFTATSMHQLRVYGQLFPNSSVGIRLNPGIGSGHSAKTNVGGRTSSFGIWHEYISEIREVVALYNLRVTRLHTHIGSGTQPKIWRDALLISLGLAEQFTDVSILDMGGGFKIARMDNEHSADMDIIGQVLATEMQDFKARTGRELRLELEPGTFLVANAGILLAQVDDIVDTGEEGYTFLKLNTGLNDILRPSLYGAQHPIAVMSSSKETDEYVVVGHNCESGDLLSPAPGEPEKIDTRTLTRASIGDIVLIGGSGAYCAGMAAHGYNAFPDAKQIIIA